MTQGKIRGRPPKWSSKIKAPEEAIAFYKMIESLQTSGAFRECHVFTGANIDHVPYISWHNEVTSLPKTILGFLGVAYGGKLCSTHGCCNPFHFAKIDDPESLEGLVSHTENKLNPTSIEDYKETVLFYIDKHELENNFNFSNLRPLIPVEDISDELLNLVLEKMQNGRFQS